MIIGHAGLTPQRTLRGPLSNRHHDDSTPDARCSSSRDSMLRPRRFHGRSSRWLHPALCTFASSFVIAPVAGLGPAWAESGPLPRSVLILDQSDADSPWYADFSATFRSTLNAGSERRFSVYSEHLDLSRFPVHSTTRFCALIFRTSIAIDQSACSLPRDRRRSNSSCVRARSCGLECRWFLPALTRRPPID